MPALKRHVFSLAGSERTRVGNVGARSFVAAATGAAAGACAGARLLPVAGCQTCRGPSARPAAGPASVQPVPGLPNGQVGASVPFHRVMFCRIQEELAEKFVIGQHHFRAWGRGERQRMHACELV